MNELTAAARDTSLRLAMNLAATKAQPSTADDVVADAETFFKFLKKDRDQQ